MKRLCMVLGVAALVVALWRLDAGAEQWVLLQAPIRLGTKSAQTTYDDSLPLKAWNWKAIADSEAACQAKMADAAREDEQSRNIGIKTAAKALGISEEQVRAKSSFVRQPQMCVRDNDPRLR
jgi:hypothetical protein